MLELDGRPATAAELGALALHNYGHFTTMRVEDARVRGLTLHLERLGRDSRILFGTDLDPLRVRHLTRRAIEATGSPATVVARVTVFDPELDIGRPVTAEPHILVSTRPAPAASPSALALRTTRYERAMPEVKGVGLCPTIHQRRAAQRAGFDDALFVDRDSLVSEGPTWNIAFVRDDQVVWPEAEVLPGVTMRLLIEVLDQRGIGSVTAPVPRHAIPETRSAFVTNATTGPRPVATIDGTALAIDDRLLQQLREGYRAIPGEEL